MGGKRRGVATETTTREAGREGWVSVGIGVVGLGVVAFAAWDARAQAMALREMVTQREKGVEEARKELRELLASAAETKARLDRLESDVSKLSDKATIKFGPELDRLAGVITGELGKLGVLPPPPPSGGAVKPPPSVA